MSLLEVDAVSYALGGRPVLDQVSLALEAGDLVGLLGPNGAGKSSLLRLMMGLARPATGHIRLHGRDLGHWSRMAMAAEVGYVPQAHVAVFPYPVVDIVAMGRSVQHGLWRSPRQTDRDAVASALEQLGIAHLARRAYTELSGGERQSVLLARAMAQGCRILLLDEPTTGLDFGQQQRLYTLLQLLSRQGYAIVASSHDPYRAREVFDQALMLRAGAVVGYGPSQDLLDDAAIRALYGLSEPLRTGPVID